MVDDRGANTRLPIDTRWATSTRWRPATRSAARRLVEMMDEFAIDDLDRLGAHVLEKSKQASLELIAQAAARRVAQVLHDASTATTSRSTLVATMKIGDTGIHVDFTGTSGVSSRGINVPRRLHRRPTRSFGLELHRGAQGIPNNAGSLAPLTRICAGRTRSSTRQKPAPVASRHIIGQMLPDVVFGCAAPGDRRTGCRPKARPACGTSTSRGQVRRAATVGNYGVQRHGRHVATAAPARVRTTDGLSATAFPSGRARNVPIEIAEAVTPLDRSGARSSARIRAAPASSAAGWARSWRSAAASTRRRSTCSAAYYDRIDHPPRGRDGGRHGAARLRWH